MRAPISAWILMLKLEFVELNVGKYDQCVYSKTSEDGALSFISRRLRVSLLFFIGIASKQKFSWRKKAEFLANLKFAPFWADISNISGSFWPRACLRRRSLNVDLLRRTGSRFPFLKRTYDKNFPRGQQFCNNKKYFVLQILTESQPASFNFENSFFCSIFSAIHVNK